MQTTSLDAVLRAIGAFSADVIVDDQTFSRLEELFIALERFTQHGFADPTRSVCLTDVAPFARVVYRHILRLRAYLQQQRSTEERRNDDGNGEDDDAEREERDEAILVVEALHASTADAQNSLPKLLRLSFDEECRKAEAALGLVGALTEILVLDNAAFGVRRSPSAAKDLRRSIGCTLTNLTFGNTHNKRQICAHSRFLAHVSALIESAPELVQSFGGLIRNLSWNADAGMIAALDDAAIVPALARTVVYLHESFAELATLNEASGARKLGADLAKCLLAAYSALWNLASHNHENKRAMCLTPNFLTYLIASLNNEPHDLLFVENASGVLKYIAGYFCTKPQILSLVHQAKILRHLLALLNSSSFTVILNALGTLSLLAEKDQRTQMKLAHSEQARLVLESLRHSTRMDVRSGVKQILSSLHSSPVAAYAAATMTTPRRAKQSLDTSMMSGVGGATINRLLLPQRAHAWQHFMHSPDGGGGGGGNAANDGGAHFCTLPYVRSDVALPPPSLPTRNETIKADDETTAAAVEDETRNGTCAGSPRASLSGDVPSGWRSSVNTTHTSRAHSPLSASALPESPTCSFDQRRSDESSPPPPPLDGAGSLASSFLDAAIEFVMPKPRNARVTPTVGDELRVGARSSSSNSGVGGDDDDDGGGGGDILDECIASVLPKTRQTCGGALELSSLFVRSQTREKVRDANRCADFAPTPPLLCGYAEDNFCVELNYEAAINDGALPIDVRDEFAAESLEIDCSTASTRSALSARSTAAPLPPPPPQPQTSSGGGGSPARSAARVPPFNYKSPAQNRGSGGGGVVTPANFVASRLVDSASKLI